MWCLFDARLLFTPYNIQASLQATDPTMTSTTESLPGTSTLEGEQPTEPAVLENCEVLDDRTQVRWTVNSKKEEVIIQLRGCEAADRKYVE